MSPATRRAGPSFVDALEDALGCPVTLENDLNLAALAEQRDGAAAGARSFVVLGLGDGFGAGLVLDGRLHRGVAGGAGEVSFLPHPARALGSEALGASSLAVLAKEHGLPDDVTVKQLVDRAEHGDGASNDALDEVAERIGVVAASVALVVEPELFVLTNQAARAPIADRVKRFLAEKIAVLPIRVVSSDLTCDAVVVGAARSASDALRDEVFRSAAAHPAPGEGDPADEREEAAS